MGNHESINYKEKKEDIIKHITPKPGNINEIDTNYAAPISETAFDRIYNSVVRIELENSKGKGTGFFIKIKIKEKSKNFIFTNFNVIPQQLVDSKQLISIYYGKKNNEIKKIIKLDIKDRFIKCFNEPKDITIIEIIEKDGIPEDKYLIPDLNYENGHKFYSEQKLYLAGYPEKDIFEKERYICSGKIKKIFNNYEFEHTLDANIGLYGSPICLLNNQCVIGIHKRGNKETHINYGTFIGIILNELQFEIIDNIPIDNKQDINEYLSKNEKKTINIDTAGQLSFLLSDWEKKEIEELVIVGKINGTDFKIIRDMATNNQLSVIDLSEANIVSGGDYYYTNYSTNHFTKNDEFGYSLFHSCKKFEKIILPKTIKKIGQCAFWYCSNLKTLVINSEVTNIEPGIWGGCNKLKDVQIINNSNFHFQNGILYDKKYTKIIAALQTEIYGDLTIQEGIKEIQYNSFSDCESLTSVIFPSTLTTIGGTSFGHSGIVSISFNKNIEIIEHFAFSSCYKLKEINLVEVKIKTLEYGTFSHCKLEVIYLPKGLIEMKQIVFAYNPLKNIFCYSKNPSNMFDFTTENATFKNVDIGNCIVHVPKGTVNIYKETKGWSNFDLIIDDI